MEEVAIKVESLSKDFLLPHEKVTTVKSAFTSALNRRGKKTKEVQHALKDISFEVKKGEFFGIVGRNGSGKSTLLKILADIYQPTKGAVQKNGKLVPFIELGVGFNPELTGRENVYLNGALMGFSKKETDAMYDDIVAFAELEKFMDQKLKNYSSGMEVRLAFSVATRAQADILVIDEVLAVGDAAFQRKCFEYFKELKRNDKTVVFVSHDMDAVREYCNRAILLEKNVIVASGASDSVATAYTKMFVDESEGPKQTGHGNRWGSRELTFEKVTLSTTKLTDENESLIITSTAKAHKDMEDIKAGFFIKNSAGTLILGTNSQILQKNIPGLKKGAEIEIKWSIPNIFSEGVHEVTLALESDANICEWWEGAAKFSVFLERKTTFIISPPVSLEIRKKGTNG